MEMSVGILDAAWRVDLHPFRFQSRRCVCESAASIFGLSRASALTTRCHGSAADSSSVRLLMTKATWRAMTFMWMAMLP